MEKTCRSRDRLFQEYRRAVKEWVASINILGKTAYDARVMQRIEDFRFRALTAKAAYENHIAEHRCGALRPIESIRRLA
jgi:hypothetical protein